MVNSSQFSKRLQKILDYYSISATSFSEIISFNRSTISHLLSGRNKPSLEFVMKVLEAYPEVELYWLLNGKGSFPSTQNKDSLKSTKDPQKEVHPFSENQNLNALEISEDQQKSFKTQTSPSPPPATDIPRSISENKKTTAGVVDRIIICYKDGTFSEYKNE